MTLRPAALAALCAFLAPPAHGHAPDPHFAECVAHGRLSAPPEADARIHSMCDKTSPRSRWIPLYGFLPRNPLDSRRPAR